MQVYDGTELAVDAVLSASRALVGVTVRSLPETADVTIVQWRALIVVDAEGALNVNALATQLGVSPSTCTRLCDRLVAKGLLVREASPGSRREVALRLAPAGEELVRAGVGRRRAEVEQIVQQMTESEQRALARALKPLIRAAGSAAQQAWVLGWAE
jgi:DNA-binding MarR family transcriptional regulator